MTENVHIELTPEDAWDLRELLLERPHREQWSSRVLVAINDAIEEAEAVDA